MLRILISSDIEGGFGPLGDVESEPVKGTGFRGQSLDILALMTMLDKWKD